MENPAFLLSFPNWEVPDENSDVMTMIKKFFTTESMKNVKEQHNHIEIALKRSDIQNLTQILSSSKSCKNWLNKFTR